LEDLGVDGTIKYELILEKQDRRWNGFIWLRIGASGRLL